MSVTAAPAAPAALAATVIPTAFAVALAAALLAAAPIPLPAAARPALPALADAAVEGACAGFTTKVNGVSDEFDGAEVDAAKWAIYPDLPGSDAEQTRSQELHYRQQNVVTQGGVLKLRLNQEGTTWTAGGVESKANVPEDTVCVVVRARGGVSMYDDNVLSAIWLQKRPLSTAGPSNPNPETDIQESIRSHRMHSALHTWTYNSTTQSFDHRGGQDEDPPWMRESTVSADLTAGFHNYAMKRQNNQLTFYLDGEEQYAMALPAEYSKQFNWGRHMILSLQGNPAGPPSDQLALPADFEVEFVHVFTP